jgi:hypothetical protein
MVAGGYGPLGGERKGGSRRPFWQIGLLRHSTAQAGKKRKEAYMSDGQQVDLNLSLVPSVWAA